MALVDPEAFVEGKRRASATWRARGEHELADAYLAMTMKTCQFGLDEGARLAWMRRGDLVVGLRFDTETGEFLTSFHSRGPRPPQSDTEG